jgi:hypothetical protein
VPNVADLLIALRERAGLSRNQLALRMGFARGTSLVHYETPENWEGKRYPQPFVARLATAIVGMGEPPITSPDVFALAAPKSALGVGIKAISLIPLLAWEDMSMGNSARIQRTIEVADMGQGDFVAAQVPDDQFSQLAPAGATVIVDRADTDLRDGRRYVIVLDGVPALRLYRTNPERWEAESVRRIETTHTTRKVEVVGRAVRLITEI